MKIQILTLAFLFFSHFAMASQDAVTQLDERITDIELRLSEKRLNTNLELQMFAGYLKNDNTLGGGEEFNSQIFKNNLRLKIQGKLNNDFSAFVSLQVSHTFNDELQSGIDSDNDILAPTHGSRPYLRTAYFDWRIHPRLILSAGRLPTTFGPPEHQKSGRARLGTYPLTSFNVPLDGVSVTIPIIDQKDIVLTSRTIYIPSSFSEPAAPQNGLSLSSAQPAKLAKGHKGFTQMLDIELKKPTMIYNKSNLIFQYSYFKMGSFVENTAPLALLSIEDPSLVDRNIYRIYADDSKLTKLKIASAYYEALGFLNTNFDLYYSFMKSWNDPTANIKAEVISDATGGATPAGKVFDLGQFISEGKSDGTRSIYGLKYNFENSFVGTEYWKTTNSPMPNDLFSDDPIALGQLSGEALHLYYTHLFYNKALSVRTGYVSINTNKVFSGFAYTDRRQNIDLAYTSIFLTY